MLTSSMSIMSGCAVLLVHSVHPMPIDLITLDNSYLLNMFPTVVGGAVPLCLLLRRARLRVKPGVAALTCPSHADSEIILHPCGTVACSLYVRLHVTPPRRVLR